MDKRHNRHPNSLPEVKPEIGKAALQSSQEAGMSQHLVNIGQRLMDEQPYLNGLLFDFIETTSRTDRELQKMIEVALFMYEMLSAQADAGALAEHVGLDKEE